MMTRTMMLVLMAASLTGTVRAGGPFRTFRSPTTVSRSLPSSPGSTTMRVARPAARQMSEAQLDQTYGPSILANRSEVVESSTPSASATR